MAGSTINITNFSKITIVKNYSYKPILRFSEEDALAIDTIYFVCKELDICIEMTRNAPVDGKVTFTAFIERATTANYDLVETTYNYNITYSSVPTEYGGFNSGKLEVVELNNPNTCEV